MDDNDKDYVSDSSGSSSLDSLELPINIQPKDKHVQLKYSFDQLTREQAAYNAVSDLLEKYTTRDDAISSPSVAADSLLSPQSGSSTVPRPDGKESHEADLSHGHLDHSLIFSAEKDPFLLLEEAFIEACKDNLFAYQDVFFSSSNPDIEQQLVVQVFTRQDEHVIEERRRKKISELAQQLKDKKETILAPNEGGCKLTGPNFEKSPHSEFSFAWNNRILAIYEKMLEFESAVQLSAYIECYLNAIEVENLMKSLILENLSFYAEILDHLLWILVLLRQSSARKQILIILENLLLPLEPYRIEGAFSISIHLEEIVMILGLDRREHPIMLIETVGDINGSSSLSRTSLVSMNDPLLDYITFVEKIIKRRFPLNQFEGKHKHGILRTLLGILVDDHLYCNIGKPIASLLVRLFIYLLPFSSGSSNLKTTGLNHLFNLSESPSKDPLNKMENLGGNQCDEDIFLLGLVHWLKPGGVFTLFRRISFIFEQLQSPTQSVAHHSEYSQECSSSYFLLDLIIQLFHYSTDRLFQWEAEIAAVTQNFNTNYASKSTSSSEIENIHSKIATLPNRITFTFPRKCPLCAGSGLSAMEEPLLLTLSICKNLLAFFTDDKSITFLQQNDVVEDLPSINLCKGQEVLLYVNITLWIVYYYLLWMGMMRQSLPVIEGELNGREANCEYQFEVEKSSYPEAAPWNFSSCACSRNCMTLLSRSLTDLYRRIPARSIRSVKLVKESALLVSILIKECTVSETYL